MRVITAAELDAMTPAEREASYRQTPLVHDLSQVPAEYRPRIEDMRRRLAAQVSRRPPTSRADHDA